ncbi:MAG: YggT family protein [Chloroflexi bacterium]|nr:YggT family protein [Chloroflexota bacterium]
MLGEILSRTISAAINIIILAIIFRSLLSFLPLDPFHPVVRLLHQFTEPFLQPIRNFMPSTGMFDFSPLVAIVLLSVINSVLQQILFALFR